MIILKLSEAEEIKMMGTFDNLRVPLHQWNPLTNGRGYIKKYKRRGISGKFCQYILQIIGAAVRSPMFLNAFAIAECNDGIIFDNKYFMHVRPPVVQ